MRSATYITLLTFLTLALNSIASAALPDWEFNQLTDPSGWRASGATTNLKILNGSLSADIPQGSEFLQCLGFSFPADSTQWIEMRIRASRPGEGQFLWAGGGDKPAVDWAKRIPFQITKPNEWQTITLIPFWKTEKQITYFRIDMFDKAHVDIACIRVRAWDNAQPLLTKTKPWPFNGNLLDWRKSPDNRYLLAPPLSLSLADMRIATIKLSSDIDAPATLFYAIDGFPGMFTERFQIRKSAEPIFYNVRLLGRPPNRDRPIWQDPIVGLGLELPPDAWDKIKLESLTFSAAGAGPAATSVRYLGFESALNRPGRPCSVLAQLDNTGGLPAPITAELILPPGLKHANSPTQTITIESLAGPASLTWPLIAEKPGDYPVTLKLSGPGALPAPAERILHFLPAVDAPKSDYVPEPHPVKTSCDIFMYYFPGWNKNADWDCIRRDAPQRRPWLGYYNEANPQLVDWQIKSLVENGVSGIFLDWYWKDGRQSPNPWLDSYLKAHYRDKLKLSLMWCNDDLQSKDNFLAMIRQAAKDYFTLPSYYRIDDKPVFVIWDSDRLRAGLGSSDAVKTALATAQSLARAAGFKGIYFIESGMHSPPALQKNQTLKAEGYDGYMLYHDTLDAQLRALSSRDIQYKDVVDLAEQTWSSKRAASAGLTYFPVLESGSDAAPWNGDGPRAAILQGRTPELFEQLARKARLDQEQHKQPFVLLGPANEWGEGSYLEPCVEYDFGMFEAVRRAFAQGKPETWPINIGPVDVGMPLPEFPPLLPRKQWTLSTNHDGWSAYSGITDMTYESDGLRIKPANANPALLIETALNLNTLSKAVIRMKVTGHPPAAFGQFFWADWRGEFSASAESFFHVIPDGQPHDYTLDLKSNLHFHGATRALRLDPCEAPGLDITIESFQLQ